MICEVVHQVLSRFGRWIGADSIPPWPRRGTDDREILGLQATAPRSCEWSNWQRTFL